MKKLFFGALVACVAATFVACGNSTPKADLKNDVDTMSYAMGMSQTQGLKEFMVERMGVDTAYMDDFIKGLNDGANAGDDKKKAAYYAGIQIGQQISNQMVKGINHEVFGDDSTKTISLKNFMAGFITGTTGKKGLMTVEQAAQVAQTKMMAIKAKNMEKEYGPNKVAGEKFLAANKKKPGVVTLPSGGEPMSLTYQPMTLKEKGLNDLGDIKYKTKWYPNGMTTQAMYLTVMHRPEDNGLDFSFEHQVKAVSRKQLEYMYYYLCKIMFKGAENPELTIGEIIKLV